MLVTTKENTGSCQCGKLCCVRAGCLVGTGCARMCRGGGGGQRTADFGGILSNASGYHHVWKDPDRFGA